MSGRAARFDPLKLHRSLDQERVLRGLTWSAVAAQVQMAQSALARMANVDRPAYPSVPALTRILAWLGPAAKFEHYVTGGDDAAAGGRGDEG